MAGSPESMPPRGPVRIRAAHLGDAPALVALIESFWKERRMMRRSLEDVSASIATFVVAEEAGEIAGCSSLFIYNPDLAELRSLGVRPGNQGSGLGKALVEATLAGARSLKVRRVFALTLETAFFQRCGFARIEKHLLPEKIWRDCIGCESFPNCNETAVVRSTEPTA